MINKGVRLTAGLLVAALFVTTVPAESFMAQAAESTDYIIGTTYSFSAGAHSAISETVVLEDTTDEYVRLEAAINKMPIEELHNFSEEVDFSVTKCLMVGDGWYIEQILPKMQKAFGDALTIFRSEPFFMEIMPQGIDKGRGLEYLLRRT